MDQHPRPTAAQDAAARTAAELPVPDSTALLLPLALGLWALGAGVAWWSWGIGAALWLTFAVLGVVGVLAVAEYQGDRRERIRMERRVALALAEAYTRGVARGLRDSL